MWSIIIQDIIERNGIMKIFLPSTDMITNLLKKGIRTYCFTKYISLMAQLGMPKL